MSHYAEVDPSTNTVVRVIVAEQDFIDSGAVGDKSRWIQTSYNTRQGVHWGTAANGKYLPDGGTALRGNYAGVGFDYIKTDSMDAFVPPIANTQWTSWTVNTSTFMWTSPLGDAPTDANSALGEYYDWDENAYKANNQTGWIKVSP